VDEARPRSVDVTLTNLPEHSLRVTITSVRAAAPASARAAPPARLGTRVPKHHPSARS
jgi:hypothetical protein